MEYFNKLFNPRNVAVLGATNNQMKVGYMVMNNIIACGFTINDRKKIYPVNPNPKYKGEKIVGFRAYQKIQEIPDQVDLATIVVPSDAVIPSVEACGEANIPVLVIITAGFKEAGGEYVDMQSELVRVAKKANIRFVGPNSMGIYSSMDSNNPLHTGMGFMTPTPGEISIISQSGTFGTFLCNYLGKIRFFVSSGNEASLKAEDYLEFYAQDEGTKVIAIFLEGLRDGKRFKKIATEITKRKPVVILKSGTTQIGSRAAASHTASIAGKTEVYEGLYKQTGVLKADNITEFLFLIKAAKDLPYPKGKRAGILAGGGGYAVYIADACEKGGLDVVPISDDLIQSISEMLPYYWSRANPIDTVATWDFNVFPKILKLMLASGEFDIILTQSLEMKTLIDRYQPLNKTSLDQVKLFRQFVGDIEKELVKKQIKLITQFKTPVILIDPKYPSPSPAFDLYDKGGIIICPLPEEAIKIAMKLFEYQAYLKRINENE
ncbi:MAG TPA: CoA-binding protein [Candidatus Deferrimicrobium sp.]|nr:CoA-binding protein [Candidatus Deferrimicrobium sp.]